MGQALLKSLSGVVRSFPRGASVFVKAMWLPRGMLTALRMPTRLLSFSAATMVATNCSSQTESAGGPAMLLPGDLHVREHVVTVPVDHGAPDGRFGSLSVFVREIVPASKAEDDLPVLLYLQGGPGFPAGRPTAPPSGWTKAALSKGYRVLLLDQRGTGRSSAVTAQSLGTLASPQEQAEFLTHFRADSIVRDCEAVRHAPLSITP